MAYVNPLEQAYRKLWEIMNEWPGLAALAKVGNRLSHVAGVPGTNTVIYGRKPSALAPADLAQLELVPAPGGTMNPYSDSTGSTITQNFALRVLSGGVDAGLFLRLKWEFFRAMNTVPEDLGIDGVVDVKIIDSFENPLNAQPGQASGVGWEILILIGVYWRLDSRELAHADMVG